MRINETVKELRIRDNMTQAELAEELNCNRQKIADWERGKTTPAADDIILLADTFDVSSDYLLGIVDNPSKDVRHVELTELTGLNEDAISELSLKHLVGWRENNTLANHIMNAFISYGLYDVLISLMTNYGRYLEAYINELKAVYQKAQETYEQIGLDIIVTDEYKRLSSAASSSDFSTNKQNMKLSYFDMAELPKEFVKAYFSDLNKEKKEIGSRIGKLKEEIWKKTEEQTNSIIKQAEQDIKEREAQNHGNDPET